MKKITFSFIFFIVLVALFSINSKVEATPSFEKEKVVIYAVNESSLNQFPELAIPDKYPQEYQIKINGTTKDIKDIKFDTRRLNYYVDISETGLVTPKKYYTSSGLAKYNFDSIDIYAYVDGYTISFTVQVRDYGYQYVDDRLKEYADSLKGLSDYEKVEKIAEYVATNFDYGTNPNHVGMFMYGSGSCSASTTMVNKLCNFAGIKAKTRTGIHDGGAGSAHVNSSVLIDGKIYVVEAGFNQKKPRHYGIYPMKSPYTYKTNEDGTIVLLHYDGFEEEKLVIPSEIDGHKVTGIGTLFYTYNTTQVKEIVLPNTITTIEERAFFNSMYLKKINIPESVNDIQGSIFDCCKEDLDIVLEENSNYIIEDDILYNKQKTKMIETLPKFKTENLVIPDTITELPLSVFRTKQCIKQVTLPKNLVKIDQFAFDTCQQLTKIVIPKSVKEIGYGAFELCTRLETIEFEDGCEAKINGNAFNQIYGTKSIRIPETITNIADTAFEKVGKNTVMYGKEGSTAEKYAKEHNIPFNPIEQYDIKLGDVNKDGKITLADYTKILAHVKKTKLLTEEEQRRADVNQDGKVTLADYTKVLAHVKKTKMLE